MNHNLFNDDEIKEIISTCAYKAGREARKLNISIEKTILKKLKFGTLQYDDFLAGYAGYKKENL